METVSLVAGVVTNNVKTHTENQWSCGAMYSHRESVVGWGDVYSHTENQWWCGAMYTVTPGISGGVGLCIQSHLESVVVWGYVYSHTWNQWWCGAMYTVTPGISRAPGEIKRSRDLRGGRWSWTLTFAQKRS